MTIRSYGVLYQLLFSEFLLKKIYINLLRARHKEIIIDYFYFIFSLSSAIQIHLSKATYILPSLLK